MKELELEFKELEGYRGSGRIDYGATEIVIEAKLSGLTNLAEGEP